MFLFIPLHPSVTNVRRIQRNSIFFTFWSARTALFYLFRWVIWSFHLIGNHQKLSETGRHGELFCFFSKQKQNLNTVSIKTSLCSIHDTVVFRNNIEVITYSYGRGNTSVYFWSPYFFPWIPFSSYTEMSECRPRVNFSSPLLLSRSSVYSFSGRYRT